MGLIINFKHSTNDVQAGYWEIAYISVEGNNINISLYGWIDKATKDKGKESIFSKTVTTTDKAFLTTLYDLVKANNEWKSAIEG